MHDWLSINEFNQNDDVGEYWIETVIDTCICCI